MHNQQTTKLFGVGMATLFLAACVSVGPDYQPQQIADMQPEGLQQIEIGAQNSSWWHEFNDPVLNQLVEAALANNYSLDAARANVKAAYAVFDDVDNGDRLTGSLSASYAAQDQLTAGTGTERTSLRYAQSGANLGLKMDLFGKIERATEAAKADAEAEHYALLDFQVALAAETAQTYALYLNSLMRIEVAEKNIQTFEKTREVISARVEEGFSSPLDLARVDADLYAVMATVPSLRTSAEQSRQALIVLTGGRVDLSQSRTGRDAQTPYPELSRPLAIGDPTRALRQRADVHEAERRLAASSARIGVQTADLYPDMSVSGFIGFVTGSSVSLGTDSQAWSVAPTLNWSGVDFDSVRTRIHIANAQQQAALAEFQEQLLIAIYQVETSLSEYRQTRQQQGLLDSQFAASSESFQLASQQFEAGAIDILDLLDVRRSLLNAEDGLVQAKSSAFAASIDVYRAFGGGVDLARVSETQI